MKYAASVLAIVPGIISFIGDPDSLGISLLIIFVLPLYIAWRTKIAGGVILILIGLMMTGLLIYNLANPPGIAPGFMSVLSWVVLIAFPIASGALFILAGMKKARA
jgi:hypothetical protein